MKPSARILAAIVGLIAPHALAEITYPIVDTGQTTAIGNPPGQDAHYLGNSPAYTDHGDGTVTDEVTGLMWIQDPGEKRTWRQAVRGESNCRVGGYRDWRLPTIKELYSLILFSGIDPDPSSTDTRGLRPFIDEVFDFRYGDTAKGERLIDSQFATATLYTSNTMRGAKTMFGVNFADGRIKGYGLADPRGRGEKTFHVLYVRGNPDYGKNRFEDHGDGTVDDEATGLIWMKADSGAGMDWPTALDYAEGMEYAGHSDWRLPSAKELQSLLDYSRAPDSTGSAAIDPVFDATEVINAGGEKDYAAYWSSTTHLGARSNTAGVYINFGRSLGWMEDRRSGRKELMDVHGAGAQRSDPKTGDASEFPHGRGPQGDVIVIENMVRLVRGGDVEAVEPPVEREVGVRERGVPPGAQQQPPPPPGRRGGQNPSFMDREDRDGDGRVSRREFKGPAEHFDHFDRNGDGYLSSDEAPTGPPAGPPRGRR